jgi:hypothetical protein
MADPIDPAKANAAAYAKASESYAKAMDAEAKKKLAEGAATAKMADTAAQQAAKSAPKVGSREWALAQGAGPNGAIPNQPATVPIPTNPAAPTTPMGGVNLAAVKPQAPVAPAPNGVQKYQDTIEAKRAGMLGYDPAAAAAAVPAEVDDYQAAVEAPRVLQGRSMGEPSTSAAISAQPQAPASADSGRVVAEAKKQSAVDRLIESMKSETGQEKGPTFWDILQAAAAGWNFQTPAYVERKKASQANAAELEKLSKTAQFEKALQEERLSSEGEQNQARLAASAKENAARIEAELEAAGIRKGIGTIPGATKGQALGIGLIQGIKTKKPAVIVPSASGGAH